jgi:hypothetical protein
VQLLEPAHGRKSSTERYGVATAGGLWQPQAVTRWELWVKRHDDGTVEESFFPDDDASGPFNRRWAEEVRAELVWRVEAKGMNDAMRKMYEYLGRGEYQPTLSEDGTPYPEDEDDEHRRPEPPEPPSR